MKIFFLICLTFWQSRSLLAGQEQEIPLVANEILVARALSCCPDEIRKALVGAHRVEKIKLTWNVSDQNYEVFTLATSKLDLNQNELHRFI